MSLPLIQLPGLTLNPKTWGYGTWVYLFCRALLSRTPRTIEDYIKSSIPILYNLLCSTCSEHARAIVNNRHPNRYPDPYTEIYDHRHENIGMFLWILDIHNDVNKRQDPPKPTYSREKAAEMYSPYYDLTTDQIEEMMRAASNPETMKNMPVINFQGTNQDKTKHQPHLPGLNLDPKTWGYGLWVAVFFDALRSRTPRTIDGFIKNNVSILVSLLCHVCSAHSYELIKAHHPKTYLGRRDGREDVSMFEWVADLHNLVNKRLEKEQYPLEKVKEMFGPLYSLSSAQISDDREASMNVETLNEINLISFVLTEENEKQNEEQESDSDDEMNHLGRPTIAPTPQVRIAPKQTMVKLKYAHLRGLVKRSIPQEQKCKDCDK